MIKRRTIFALALLFAPALAHAADAPSADQIVERMRAAYTALKTYSDTGVIVAEDKNVGAPATTERHTFTTKFAAPKQFVFEFKKDPTVADERFVIWCPGDAMSSWWSASQTAETYPPGQGQNAFAVSEFPTAGTALLVPPLLFAPFNLHGPLVDSTGATFAGTETIDGHRTYVLSADLRANHWSDTTRPTKIWVDVDSYLVRKFMQDTPTGQGSGVIQRVTVTFEPVANPPLATSVFTFTPPAAP